jgi:hypothetical protein
MAGEAARMAATEPGNPMSGSTVGTLEDAVLRFKPSRVAPTSSGMEIERRAGTLAGAASNA